MWALLALALFLSFLCWAGQGLLVWPVSSHPHPSAPPSPLLEGVPVPLPSSRLSPVLIFVAAAPSLELEPPSLVPQPQLPSSPSSPSAELPPQAPLLLRSSPEGPQSLAQELVPPQRISSSPLSAYSPQPLPLKPVLGLSLLLLLPLLPPPPQHPSSSSTLSSSALAEA